MNSFLQKQVVLGQGQWFGEEELLNDNITRKHSVQCLSEFGYLHKIRKSDLFEKILSHLSPYQLKLLNNFSNLKKLWHYNYFQEQPAESQQPPVHRNSHLHIVDQGGQYRPEKPSYQPVEGLSTVSNFFINNKTTANRPQHNINRLLKK